MTENPKNRKKTPVRKAFGLKLKLKRVELGLTQEQLAEHCGLHSTYIGSVERGERNISLENIILLSQALGCSARDLLPE